MTLDQFRLRVAAHLKRTGEAPSRFGRRVLNDPTWVYRLLDDGLEPKEATRTRVLKAISEWKASAA
jgi:hypothetical protein